MACGWKVNVGAAFLRVVRAPASRKSCTSHRPCDAPGASPNTSTVPLNTMATNSIKLLTGNSYPELARLVADRYVQSPPVPLTPLSGLQSCGCAAMFRCSEYIALGRAAPRISPRCYGCSIEDGDNNRSSNFLVLIKNRGLITNPWQARHRTYQDSGTSVFEPGDFCNYRRVCPRRGW